MPDFEQRKRRSLTDQQLYEEYHNVGKKSSKKKKSSAKKNNSKNKMSVSQTAVKKTSAGEAPTVSSYMAKKQEQNKSAAAAAKKSKTFAGKVGSGKKRSSTVGTRNNAASRNKRSKRKQGRYTLYYIFIGILVVVALSILSTTVLFNIGVFVVEGEVNYSDEEIIEASGIRKGENLLRVNIGRAEESIVSKLVYIDSASIHRGFPNRLTISVEPALPAVSLSYGGRYYIVSERGRLLEIKDSPSDCPIVKGFAFDSEAETEVGGTLEDDSEKRLSLALSIKNLLYKYGFTAESVIDITDMLQIKINYDNRVEMELGTSASLEEKIYNGSIIMAEDIAENEKCTLLLSNLNQAYKRPIHDEASVGVDDDYIVTEATTAEEGEAEETSAEDEGE